MDNDQIDHSQTPHATPPLSGPATQVTQQASRGKLHENEELLRLFIEHVPAALAMFDRTMHYLCTSRRWLQDYGLGDRDLTGLSHYEVFPEISDAWKDAHRRGLAGEVLCAEAERFERADGSVQWVRREIRPWHDAAGEVAGIVIFTEDITAGKQAEEEIRASKDYFQSLFYNMAEGVALHEFIHDSQGTPVNYRLLDINHSYEMILGLRREEIIGKLATEAYGVSEPPYLKEFCDVTDSGTARRIETYFAPMARHFDISVVPWGRSGFATIFTDITERKKAETLLRRYELLARHSRDIILFVRSDDGRILEANAAATEAYGYDHDEFPELSIHDLRAPETTAMTSAQLAEASIRGILFETVHRRRDGSTFPVEVSSQGTTIDGIRILISVIRDITDRKGAEDALRESELFYRQLLESIPGMVFTTRPDGYCDFQSQQWVDFTGVPMIEHLGDGWNRLLHPDDRPRAFAAWRDAVEERAPYDLEYRVRRHDGAYEWFKVRGQPIHNTAGEIVRWFGTALNIDTLVKLQKELRQAKEEAEEASRAKSEFVANMSHEIRTPMTVFLMAIEQLLQINTDPASRQLLEMADKAAETLRGLVDDILDFSRIEAGSVDIADEPFNPVSALQEVIEMFSLAAREKNLLLTWNVSPEVPSILFGDWFRIKQVLINLIGNAVKFTPEGSIDVTVRPQGKQLVFAVADTGIGIPAEKRHLIFESFRQVDASFHRQYGGSGLGLAICKGLVELMGGRITVQGREKGVVFSFTLPLKAPESVPQPIVSAPPEETSRNVNQARILLVDDEPMILDVINLALTLRGWQTETARSGVEAIKKWQHREFDIILMDLQMPAMSGLEATRLIRQNETGKTSRTSIIGFTAHVGAAILENCREAGMDLVLHKPVKVDELYLTIDQLLAK